MTTLATPAQRCLCCSFISMYFMRTPKARPAAGACRAAGRGAQGDVMFGGAVVNLGGGGDEPTPNPDGGGDSVRTLQSCGDGTCQFVEVRMVYGAGVCCAPARVQGCARMQVEVACTQPCTLVMVLLPIHPLSHGCGAEPS